MESVREIVKRRDGISDAAFDELLERYLEDVNEWNLTGEGDDPEELIAEWFGLEPDYLFDAELMATGG